MKEIMSEMEFYEGIIKENPTISMPSRFSAIFIRKVDVMKKVL